MYNLILLDHPSNSKCGGACIYYKNVLLEFLIFIISKRILVCNWKYRSSQQTQDEFGKLQKILKYLYDGSSKTTQSYF